MKNPEYVIYLAGTDPLIVEGDRMECDGILLSIFCGDQLVCMCRSWDSVYRCPDKDAE
ncbi:hypothetical protein [Pseudomonas carnis]|uniref:hypothetical protein n=1 Tax=Pseudomonas carnis TaxID=2487355 RepID=UPI0019697D11|nr:hypothetical protein [Pseudomonas carnis]